MASSLAFRRLLSSNHLSNSLRQVTVGARSFSSRFFNTNTLRDYEDDDRSLDVDRRPVRYAKSRQDFSPFSADVFDPFSTRSLSQILNTVDQLTDFPFHASRGTGAAGFRRDWNAEETDDGLYLRMDMPGLGREDVKVAVEQNTLIIKGEVREESDDGEEGGGKYGTRIHLPDKLYNTNEIKAEMKNGRLKVFVPKVKEEDRTDVFHVKVE